MRVPQFAGNTVSAIFVTLVFALPAATQTIPPAASRAGQSQMAMSATGTMAQVLDAAITSEQSEIAPAAQAMPADKYNFAPTQGNFAGVRTFAQEVKHIAAANYEFGAQIIGEKPPVAAGPNENGPDNMTDKPDIVKLLLDSFDYVHKAIATITPMNALQPLPNSRDTRLSLAVLTASHAMDHYGQMVEYLRMNNIVPPASANSKPANPGHE